MRIFILIFSNIMIAAIALFAASEIFALKRYNSFIVPYTDKLISMKIIPKDKREEVLREDKVSHLIGVGISVLACGMMTAFLVWPSGLIVFIVVLAGAMLFIHPDMTETPATREGYFRMHKNSLDPVKYADMVKQLNENADKEASI